MKTISEYKPVILGIDHGYGNIKTAHRIFLSGVDRLAGEAITEESILRYKGCCYAIGESHLTYLGEKTGSDDFYILTLAAIAEELRYRGMNEANIILAAGLPLAWTMSQGKSFRQYLQQEKDLEFDYKGKHYHVYISRVYTFPQGLAETYALGSLDGENMIVDIGNGTMNVARISNGIPIEKSLVTENFGVSICVRNIQQAISKFLGRNVEERVIENLIRSGCKGRGDNISKITEEYAGEYAREIARRLAVHGFETGYMRLYVFGGGGCLLKNYSDYTEDDNVIFNEDICANAKGYEFLARKKLELSERKTA